MNNIIIYTITKLYINIVMYCIFLILLRVFENYKHFNFHSYKISDNLVLDMIANLRNSYELNINNSQSLQWAPL